MLKNAQADKLLCDKNFGMVKAVCSLHRRHSFVNRDWISASLNKCDAAVAS